MPSGHQGVTARVTALQQRLPLTVQPQVQRLDSGRGPSAVAEAVLLLRPGAHQMSAQPVVCGQNKIALTQRLMTGCEGEKRGPHNVGVQYLITLFSDHGNT